MRAQWNFKIPAGTIIQPGDTMTLKVPEVLGLGNSAAFGINDEQGNTIGNAQVSPTTGDIVITFTDAITEAETAAINGQFYLGVKWVEGKVSFDEKVEIKWTENISSTVTIASGSFRPEDNEGIKKWGYIDAEDPALIHWTARINFSENLDTTINNAIFQDELGPNQKLVPGSVSGFYVIGWEDNWYAKAGELIPNSMINMTDDTHFTVTFGDLKGPVYINYMSRITDDVESDQYSNVGTLTGDGFATKTDTEFVKIAGGGGNSGTSVTVAGVKTWLDNDDAAGVRPSSIELELYQNNNKIDTQSVTADADWHFSFSNLPNFDENHAKYQYRVEEVPVPNYKSLPASESCPMSQLFA